MWLKRQSEARKLVLKPLGSLESPVMDYVWKSGEISARDLHAVFSSLAYTTVMTTLDRLYKKGMLDRRKVGKAFFYTAALTESAYRERLTHYFFGMAMHDGPNHHAVLSCFVDAVTEKDTQMLDKLDQLVKAKRRALRRPE